MFAEAVKTLRGIGCRWCSPGGPQNRFLAGVIRTIRVVSLRPHGASTAIRGIVARKASEAAKSSAVNPVEDVLVAVGVF